MDIKVSDKLLRKFLTTKATPKDIMKYLSLSGPSVEKYEKVGDDYVYSIEITTNRVDSASAYGIAKEAATILPRFNISAEFNDNYSKNITKTHEKVSYLEVYCNHNLCPRFLAFLVRDISIGESPMWMKEILKTSGHSIINNVVDLTNYVMLATGQPLHVFDYDKIENAYMNMTLSKKGDVITTLDNQKVTLPGNDIIIKNKKGVLIDLCGIMGGANSAVSANTRNVLFFIQNYEPLKIRRTSMKTAKRSDAATLFEKGIDPEAVTLATNMTIDLLKKMFKEKDISPILDMYPKKIKTKIIKVKLSFISKVLGVVISPHDIKNYLTPLGFGVSIKEDEIEVVVPTSRIGDINIPVDICEEIARIYGYHNITSCLMGGLLPNVSRNKSFGFEEDIKTQLTSLGATEIYTLSLVSKDEVDNKHLQLKNPLGDSGSCLRTSLLPSLKHVADENKKETFIHLFEMANVYIPRKNDLPEEQLILGGIIKGDAFVANKGKVIYILEFLGIKYSEKVSEEKYFLPGQSINIISNGKIIGRYGNLESGYFYYEFGVEKLFKIAPPVKKIILPSKYPPQVEDITLVIPQKTKIGNMIKDITEKHKQVVKFTLRDQYKDSYTFRVWYQDKNKTLTNSDVEKLRSNMTKLLKQKYGVIVK